MSNNTTNLGTVMNALRINSRVLAEMLNIHYSLVSKWINGKRPLKQNSNYMKQIVTFFMGVDEPNNYAVIRSILQESYSAIDLSSKEELAVYLIRYLATDVPVEVEQTAWDRVDRSKISNHCKFDIYTNVSGRQAAILRLVSSANMLQGQEILVYGNESIVWQQHRSGANYLKQIREEQYRFLADGGRFTILHSVDRTDEELVQSILYWMPLHLTKQTKAYYIPEYSDSPIKTSTSVLRGKASLFGFSASTSSSALTTYYSTDTFFVNKMEELFYSLKGSSVYLFEQTAGSNPTEQSLEFSARKSPSIMYSAIPFQYCFSEAFFRQILKENKTDLDVSANAMIFCELDQKRLISALSSKPAYLLIDYESMKEIVTTGTSISYMNWITGTDLKLSAEEVKQAYLLLCDIAEKYENLHLCLLESAQFSYPKYTTLLVKENTSFLANKTDQSVPGPLTIREPTIVSAMYRYFDRIRKTIPKPYRDRDNVIEIIRSLCAN